MCVGGTIPARNNCKGLSPTFKCMIEQERKDCASSGASLVMSYTVSENWGTLERVGKCAKMGPGTSLGRPCGFMDSGSVKSLQHEACAGPYGGNVVRVGGVCVCVCVCVCVFMFHALCSPPHPCPSS